MSDGERYYTERGWSGCAGSAWERLTEATRDGWRHAAAAEARAESSERKVAAVERIVAGYETIARFNPASWKRYANVANDLRAALRGDA